MTSSLETKKPQDGPLPCGFVGEKNLINFLAITFLLVFHKENLQELIFEVVYKPDHLFL